MANAPFYEEGSRVLTPPAFEFVLDSELRRAVRSQNFLTLVVLEAKREWEGLIMPADEGTVQKVAQVIGRDVRDTDLFGSAEGGTLCLVLLDADYEHSAKVIDRLISRIEHYDFPAPIRIAIGAACYPTHAVDADSLRKEALARPLVHWRTSAHVSSRN